MDRRKEQETETHNLDVHPAVRAWLQLDGNRSLPGAIQRIRGMDAHTAVFRLVGIGSNNRAVIAKKAELSKCITECYIYENALAYLSGKNLRCYGYVETADRDCWMFMEDVGGSRFSFRNDRHASLATNWLAELHTVVPKLEGLADRGLEYYRSRLIHARRMIVSNWHNPALRDPDRVLLKSILANFEYILRRWESIAAVYDRMPKGLIHADFKAPNLRIGNDPAGDRLLVFDWEDAGWGLPGIDMWRLNPADYWIQVRKQWTGISFETITQLSKLGKLLWCFNAIAWQAESLRHQWLERAMIFMKAYDERLSGAIQEALPVGT